jgi:hypothetical protein
MFCESLTPASCCEARGGVAFESNGIETS